jgi:hypothetical protein
MWAHYGDHYAGVCLKLDALALERALMGCGYPWKRIAVNYTLSEASRLELRARDQVRPVD